MMILQYFRNRAGKRIGVFVAIPVSDNAYSLGYSLCRQSFNWETNQIGDDFDAERGKEIALGRAEKVSVTGDGSNVPHSMKFSFHHFMERAARYYKDRQLVSAPPKRSLLGLGFDEPDRGRDVCGSGVCGCAGANA